LIGCDNLATEDWGFLMQQKITFLEGKHTLDVVRNILEVEKREIALAVAFWGDSAIEKLCADAWKAKKVSIICNATSGCCNPSVLEYLQKKFDTFSKIIKTNPKLHAKVYWTPDKMVITSANASSSGLWMPGLLEGNVEAGVLVESKVLIESVKEWFDKLFVNDQTVKLDQGIIRKAWIMWLSRLARETDEKPRRPKTGGKVLNVMDKYIDVRLRKNGFYSGVWHSPDRGCNIVRVFRGDSQISGAGGRIIEDVRVGDGRRRISFRDEESQHRKPRPPQGFKQNGCRATAP
jgi:hypothetical protein